METVIANRRDLSICIVSWNICEKLRECLRSIYAYSDGLDIEVIVVDNASSDGTVENIRKEFPDVILVLNGVNEGFGKANNIGIAKAVGDFVLMLNPDIVLTESCLTKMIDVFRSNDRAGILSCKLINGDGKTQKNYFETFPTPLNDLCLGLFLRREIRSLKAPNTNERTEVAWVAGACIMMRKKILEQLQGFDERYFMYAEDVDLCYRVWKLGLGVYYLANITMKHYHGESARKQKVPYFSAVMQRESIYRFMRARYGSLKGYEYRLVWIFIGTFRMGILLVLYPMHRLVFKEKMPLVSVTLKKYAGIVRWGLGGLGLAGLREFSG